MPTYDAQDWAATWEFAAGGFAVPGQQWDYPPDTLPSVAAPPPVLVAPPSPAPPVPVDVYGLGIDLDCLYDITPSLSLTSGPDNLAKALARRLITPRGALFYDPDYGLDVREYLHAGVTAVELATLPEAIAAEVEKDPRVQSCEASTVFDGRETLVIKLRVTPSAGPHQLIIVTVTDQSISALTQAAA